MTVVEERHQAYSIDSKRVDFRMSVKDNYRRFFNQLQQQEEEEPDQKKEDDDAVTMV